MSADRYVLGHVPWEPPPGHIRGMQALGKHLQHVTKNRGEPAEVLARELAPPVKAEKKARHFSRLPAKVARSTSKTVMPGKKP